MSTINKIEDFDYLIVKCGYTHRLMKHLNDIREKAAEIVGDDDYTVNEKNVVVYVHDGGFDKVSIEKCTKMCGDPEDFDMVATMLAFDHYYGSICFRCKKLFEAFCIVEKLQEYHHCACFGMPCTMELLTKDKFGTRALVMDFDTESG